MALLTRCVLAIRRRRPGEADDNPQRRQPVSQVHVDQTTASSIERVHRHLPASDAPALLKRRFQIINLWRPISHAALDWPLGLCDFRSVDMKKDLIPIALVYPDREGETFGVKFNEAHKWKYMKGMEPDEFVLIKWYVSPAFCLEEPEAETRLASIPCKMEVWRSLRHTLGLRTRMPPRERHSGSPSRLGRWFSMTIKIVTEGLDDSCSLTSMYDTMLSIQLAAHLL